MSKVTFFVEGINDELFLRQLIRKIYGIELGERGEVGGFIICGEHNAQYRQKQMFQISTGQEYQNIVFEDADFEQNNRGFEKVKELLEKQKQDHHLSFDYFIYPNHAEEGTLETLLSNIAQQPKNEWIECAENYFDCLAKSGFSIPDAHGRWDYIAGYLLKDKKLDFSDETTWKIDNNPYLRPLITFLDMFLK